MKTKGVLFLICALTYVTAVAEYNCWASVNGIGDYMIVAVGELDKPFTMAKPISIDLAPTNAPDENASYSVRCRVCYIDNLLPCPKSDDDLKLVRLTGKVLNSLLKEFIAGQYVAAEYKELIEAYFNGDFVRDLNNPLSFVNVYHDCLTYVIPFLVSGKLIYLIGGILDILAVYHSRILIHSNCQRGENVLPDDRRIVVVDTLH